MFLYAQQHSDLQLEAAFDKKLYRESELVSIQIPLSLPYQTEQANFERVDGEVRFNGKIYKYVKRKISGGNLILLCLPNYNKMRLAKGQDDFFKEANSLAQNTGSKKQENSKSSFKNLGDYEHLQYRSFPVLAEEHLSHQPPSYPDSPLAFAPHASPEQPPELG